jgi:S1-C subfamily serine protease
MVKLIVMKNTIRMGCILLALLGMGCVSTYNLKPDIEKYSSFSCEELNKEISVVVGYLNEALGERGLTPKSAALGFLFGGIGANISNEAAHSAAKEADEQKKFLYEIFDKKNCSEELYQLGKSSKPSQIVRQTPTTTDPSIGTSKILTTGTGFLFSTKDYIITNWHVVKGAGSILAKFTNGDTVEAKVVAKDVNSDIAVLKLTKAPPLSAIQIKLGDSSQARMGEKIFTIGYPASKIMGEKPKYSEGVINAMTGLKDDPAFFQVSVPVQPGNSGGPLFNERGEVIGITTASLSSLAMDNMGAIAQNVNYAIKSSFLKNLLSTIPELMLSNTGIVVIPNEPKKSLPNFFERVSNNIVLIEAKE